MPVGESVKFPENSCLVHYTDHLSCLWCAPFKKENSHTAVVYLHGLGDGLLCCGYLTQLSHSLNDRGLHFVSPLLRSSYEGWRVTDCLDHDIDDIKSLLRFMHAKKGIRDVFLIGFSTGTQQIVLLLRSQIQINRETITLESMILRGCILHGPVSDREYEQWVNPHYQETLEICESIEINEIERRRNSVKESSDDDDSSLAEGYDKIMEKLSFLKMKQDHHNLVVSYRRWLSLNRKHDTEDLFSSDLSESYMRKQFYALTLPTLVIMCGGDEFVPPSVDKSKLIRRMSKVISEFNQGRTESMIIPKSDHYITDLSNQQMFIHSVLKFVDRNRGEIIGEARMEKTTSPISKL